MIKKKFRLMNGDCRKKDWRIDWLTLLHCRNLEIQGQVADIGIMIKRFFHIIRDNLTSRQNRF